VTTPDTSTVWYRAGRRAARLFRFALIGFFVSIGVIALSSLAPKHLQAPIAVAAVVIGSVCGLLAGFLSRQIGLTFFAVYVALVGVGSIIQGFHPRPKGALIGIAIATIGTALAGLGFFIRAGRRSTELERLLFAESTSTAFFVTMLFALTWSLLEAWIDAPKLSMWVVWSVGMFSWGVLSGVFKRRYS
jgi:hypothetical protein